MPWRWWRGGLEAELAEASGRLFLSPGVSQMISRQRVQYTVVEPTGARPQQGSAAGAPHTSCQQIAHSNVGPAAVPSPAVAAAASVGSTIAGLRSRQRGAAQTDRPKHNLFSKAEANS